MLFPKFTIHILHYPSRKPIPFPQYKQFRDSLSHAIYSLFDEPFRINTTSKVYFRLHPQNQCLPLLRSHQDQIQWYLHSGQGDVWEVEKDTSGLTKNEGQEDSLIRRNRLVLAVMGVVGVGGEVGFLLQRLPKYDVLDLRQELRF